MTRARASRALFDLVCRFFYEGPGGVGVDEIFAQGFYFLLSMNTVGRVWNSEISTIDTTYLLGRSTSLRQCILKRQAEEEREMRAGC